MLCASATAFSQTIVQKGKHNRYLRTVFLDVFGNSGNFGVSYDAPFSRTTSLGYKVGLAYHNTLRYTDVSAQLPFNYVTNIPLEDSNRMMFIPVEINSLHGKKNHFFEVAFGGGIGYSISNRVSKDNRMIGENVSIRELVDLSKIEYKRNGITFSTSISLGYRFQADNGLTIRAGFSGVRTFSSDPVANDIMFKPYYISIGYSFW